MRAAQWGLLISRGDNPIKHWRTEGFDRYVLDNGAWWDFQANRPFDDDAFERLIDKLGANCDWIVLPDIVAGGLASLDLSMRWMNRCLATAPMVLIAVQDGMNEDDLAPLVGRNVGIFLGGSTEWKMANMLRWGAFCAARGIHYHVARVNTCKRVWLAQAAGAHSIDGTSGSRFACTIPMLATAMRQLSLPLELAT